ncbi:MAG: hypothetical protein LBU74_04060 [Methanobacteriaceae archaeon]|jgi:hypothetical protein|nr:hypothetical protein [Candidatus Methanorudis spinitermitis]
MDSKGIATVDFLFTLILTLIIAISTLNLIGTNLNTEKSIEEDINGRIILEKLANSINQVNSNFPGNIQEIHLSNNISNNSYIITVKSGYITLEFNNKEGKSAIFPINLVDFNMEHVTEIKLYSGENYKIKKSLDKNNISVIQIYRVG